MVRELKEALNIKKQEYERIEKKDAYKLGEITNRKNDILNFESYSMRAIYVNETLVNFQKSYQKILNRITKLSFEY